MNKPIKILIGALCAVIAVPLIVIIIGFALIDRAAAGAIGAAGTYALGVNTSVGSADVKVFAGELKLADLRIANPEGFDTPHFLLMNSGDMAVSLKSLRSETVTVPRVILTDLDVHLQKTSAGTNYKVILENLKRLESGEKPPPSDDQGGKNVVVEELRLENISVHVDLARVGGEFTKLDLKIPQIALTNIGSDGAKPMDVAGVIGVVVKAVLVAVAQNAGDLLPTEFVTGLTSELANLSSLGDLGIDMAGGAINAVGDVAGNLGEMGKGLGENVGEGVEKAAEGVGDAVKGLFGGKKDGGE